MTRLTTLKNNPLHTLAETTPYVLFGSIAAVAAAAVTIGAIYHRNSSRM